MKPSLVIIGSSNTDMVIKAERLPSAGETILGGNFYMNPGGKGANQAIAAQRLGGNVNFICKTGNDIFGNNSIKLFKEEGLNTDYILTDPLHSSGIALITVDKNAQNCIVVAPGANGSLTPNDLKKYSDLINNASFILMQLEIPIETVEYVATIARSKQIKVILNPAPACDLPSSLLKNIWMITPNEMEAEMLSGVTITDMDSIKEAAIIIKEKGVQNIIITLGERGAFIFTKDTCELVPSPKVNAIDTTAAGDVFNGALAVSLSENIPLKQAVNFACHAAALSVTKKGAQASAPYRNDVEIFLKQSVNSEALTK